ncbi:hypothetical protein BKA61DRAFT_309655 [Leptodontidium sp. MPI-SDFR-AT-0119]|nr:hypothetical protein BKA61DRAFT_309655 [Leptodontidium sp. MPI-SDFR-AT-0119]
MRFFSVTWSHFAVYAIPPFLHLNIKFLLLVRPELARLCLLYLLYTYLKSGFRGGIPSILFVYSFLKFFELCCGLVFGNFTHALRPYFFLTSEAQQGKGRLTLPPLATDARHLSHPLLNHLNYTSIIREKSSSPQIILSI